MPPSCSASPRRRCRAGSAAIIACPKPANAQALADLLARRSIRRAMPACAGWSRARPCPVHLICDLTHRLLAASPPRLADWAADARRAARPIAVALRHRRDPRRRGPAGRARLVRRRRGPGCSFWTRRQRQSDRADRAGHAGLGAPAAQRRHAGAPGDVALVWSADLRGPSSCDQARMSMRRKRTWQVRAREYFIRRRSPAPSLTSPP